MLRDVQRRTASAVFDIDSTHHSSGMLKGIKKNRVDGHVLAANLAVELHI